MGRRSRLNSKKIVTIGGGSFRKSGTLKIDKEIIKLSGKKNPKLLFIPTASSDNEKYWLYLKKYFTRLGCKCDVLFLLSKPKEKNKILKADIIYVGGGNTLMMMKLWKKLGIDKLLKKAYNKGTVLSGLSAGSICWFDSGHSDSMSYYNKKKWKYINVKGLGFIKGIHCPHYDSHTLNIPRKKKFHQMIKKIGGLGIAIDNSCAIEFIDNKFRVIQAKKNAKAYKVFKKDKKVIEEEIPISKKLLSIKTLIN